MKTTRDLRTNSWPLLHKLLLASTASALLCLAATGATAQTYSVIKSFGILTNVMGSTPVAVLVQGPDGTLHGTAPRGDCGVAGVVFKVQPDGTGFAALKYFTNPLINLLTTRNKGFIYVHKTRV